MTDQDNRFLNAAIRYARKNQGQSGTNPSVACLIVADTSHGKAIVGRGITAIGGRPHAEPVALEEAGNLAKGATAYVTLEPCAHHGKTPPCAQALIDAGISRVVTAMCDPDNRVNGKGHAMLTDAGIEVVEFAADERAARAMSGYLKIRDESRPFATLKLAMTDRGLMGSTSGERIRITGPESNAQVHLMRARHDAILVGSGTAIADNPNLTCRLDGLESRSPIRIVLDSSGVISEDLELVQTADQCPTWIAAPAGKNVDKLTGFAGVEHLACELHEGQVALPELLDDLGARGIQSLMVEGGATIAKSFLDEGLVDELAVLVGAGDELADMKDAVYAPVTPENLPQGFVLAEEMLFGKDRFLRFTQAK